MIRYLRIRARRYPMGWQDKLIILPRIVRLESGRRYLVAFETMQRRRSNSGRGWIYRIPEHLRPYHEVARSLIPPSGRAHDAPASSSLSDAGASNP